MAESLIRSQHELDADNPTGGALGDKHVYHYLGLFADESLDEHLASRRSLWLRKKDMGETVIQEEVESVRNLMNAVTTYVANMHEENLLSYYGEQPEEQKIELEKQDEEKKWFK